jgi:hypothetical protein
VKGSTTLQEDVLRGAERRSIIGNVTIIDLYIAKNVFQVHRIDADGKAVVRNG